MTAAAAAAWVQLADASAAALQRQPGDCTGGLPVEALSPELMSAVDGATAQGLAPLVPAQLLATASAALHMRLAHLRSALAAVLAATAGSAGAGAVSDEENGEDQGNFTTETEAAFAEALKVRAAQASCSCFAVAGTVAAHAACMQVGR